MRINSPDQIESVEDDVGMKELLDEEPLEVKVAFANWLIGQLVGWMERTGINNTKLFYAAIDASVKLVTIHLCVIGALQCGHDRV